MIDFFNSIIPLKQEEKELIRQYFHLRSYKKRMFVLQEGDVCQHLNFVLCGCLRMYKDDENGSPHILLFATEGSWINDLDSYYQEKKSLLNIDVLENAELLQISRQDIVKLYLNAPKFDRIFRILTEKNLVLLQNRMLENISLSAEDRYYNFLSNHPDLINRIPQVHIASYLGVSAEFISRLRSRRARNPLMGN
ncbi:MULTISPECIES: Crp/Fnr family transcriptional regulator [Sphingobacterium]|nr:MULTISPECIES: Crp/Fnr family transcriptional regulator [Sphingobacterium]